MSNNQNKRSELLSQMSYLLKTWDGTSSSAEEIISQNNLVLADLKQNDKELNLRYNTTEQEEVAIIIERQKTLIEVIKQERSNIMKKMQQVNKKDKIVNHYYSSFQQSIFVDQGM